MIPSGSGIANPPFRKWWDYGGIVGLQTPFCKDEFKTKRCGTGTSYEAPLLLPRPARRGHPAVSPPLVPWRFRSLRREAQFTYFGATQRARTLDLRMLRTISV